MTDPIKLASGGKINPAYLEHAKQSFLREEEVQAFVNACGEPLRKSVRVNTLKSSVSEFKKVAENYGWQLEPIPWCEEGFWIGDSSLSDEFSLGNTPEHILGLFYIQEASSMLPAEALLNSLQLDAPVILDMAAAPGSKTTQLAAKLNNQGLVVANELSASRLKSLHNNLVRCGILNTAMSHHDGRKFSAFVPGRFDLVLLDAPCGGEGTVRKDIHALENWNIDKVIEIGELQKELIMSAYGSLKPGGKLVYSTCTLSFEENQAIARYLLENSKAQVVSLKNLFNNAQQSLTSEGYLHVLPHIYNSEGFFVSCFSKPEDDVTADEVEAKYQSPFEKLAKTDKQRIVGYYDKHFGIDIEPSGYQLLQRQKEVWIFPNEIERLNSFMKVNRAGMKIAEVYPNKIRSSHEFACCFGQQAEKQVVEASKVQFSEFVKGQNLFVDELDFTDGEVLLSFENKIFGIGQKQKYKLKNGYPRELVKDGFSL